MTDGVDFDIWDVLGWEHVFPSRLRGFFGPIEVNWQTGHAIGNTLRSDGTVGRVRMYIGERIYAYLKANRPGYKRVDWKTEGF